MKGCLYKQAILKHLQRLQGNENCHPAVLSSLDQNKLFVSESLVPLTQLAKWYKEPTKQFSEL